MKKRKLRLWVKLVIAVTAAVLAFKPVCYLICLGIYENAVQMDERYGEY